MTTLLVLLFVSTFTVDYFAIKLELISRYMTLVPEIFSLIIALVIVGRAVALRKWDQPGRYAWFFTAFVLVCMIAVVAVPVDPGPLVSGLRNYFKFLPLLFLPAVYDFSEKQLKILIGTYLTLALLQVPLAFFQRFVQFSDKMHTGDPITGSVTVSSALTMVLCVAIALVMTLYVHRKISLLPTLLLFCVLASPTTINETKATILLLPAATLGPFFLARGVDRKWGKLLPILGICIFGVAVFTAVYNTMIEARWGGTGITDFLTGEAIEAYLYRGSSEDDLVYSIGRLDSMILPVRVLSDDWMHILFGLGIGNVSPSPLPGLTGAYFEMGKELGFGMTAIGNLIWETGLVGLFLYLLLFFLIWREARTCAKIDGETGWRCTWWSTCILIYVFGLAYKSVLELNELGYLLYFWSGVLASRGWRLRRSAASGARLQQTPAPRLQLAGR